jgi:protein phosphatase-4 regulatory subunit 3
MDNNNKFSVLEKKIKEDDFIVQLGKILIEEEKKFDNFTNVDLSTKVTELSDNNNLNNNLINNLNSSAIENINLISNIIKNILLLADKSLLKILMNDDNYLTVFGALEYDFETNKIVPHRKYFTDIVKFKNLLDIQNKEILDKIHLNHRLSYLKDTAICRFIEENTLKIINTTIQLNNNEIIQFFLQNPENLKSLLDLTKDNNIIIKKDGCLFLVELMNCSFDVFNTRISFIETLCEYKIFEIIDNLLNDISNNENNLDLELNELKKDNNSNNEENKNYYESIKISIIEILIKILTCASETLKEYLLNNNESKILIILCKLMLSNDNFGIKYEISQIIKIYLDSEFQDTTNQTLQHSNVLIILIDYLEIPMNLKYKTEITNNKQIIIEILIYIIERNYFFYFFNDNKVYEKVIKLLDENNKILNIYVIKFIKSLLLCANDFLISNIITSELMNKLCSLFEQNKKQENLLFSILLDFFIPKLKNKLIIQQFLTLKKDFFYSEENKIYFKEYFDKTKNIKDNIYENNNYLNQESNDNDEDIFSPKKLFFYNEFDDNYQVKNNNFLDKKRMNDSMDLFSLNEVEENKKKRKFENEDEDVDDLDLDDIE